MDLATTISDVYEMLSGNCDDIPEAAFYMVGGLVDVKEKAWPRPLRNETCRMGEGGEGGSI